MSIMTAGPLPLATLLSELTPLIQEAGALAGVARRTLTTSLIAAGDQSNGHGKPEAPAPKAAPAKAPVPAPKPAADAAKHE